MQHFRLAGRPVTAWLPLVPALQRGSLLDRGITAMRPPAPPLMRGSPNERRGPERAHVEQFGVGCRGEVVATRSVELCNRSVSCATYMHACTYYKLLVAEQAIPNIRTWNGWV